MMQNNMCDSYKAMPDHDRGELVRKLLMAIRTDPICFEAAQEIVGLAESRNLFDIGDHVGGPIGEPVENQ